MRLSIAKRMLACTTLLLLSVLNVQASVSDSIYNMDDYRNHPCNRQCEHMAPPRLCKYRFTVENYWTQSKACMDCPFNQSDCFRPHCVSTDGVSRQITVVNRQLPGPAIEVCEGDTVEVKVYNDLQNSEGTSVHWHGILQKGTPYMDGTSMITQCPITPYSSFTYRFLAEDPGTHFWHSHAGMQRADGMFGAIVVRQSPMKEVHHALYDYDLSEHVIVLNDWLRETALARFLEEHHNDRYTLPRLMLINGLGAGEEFTRDNTTYHTPRAVFTVRGGNKYRFRVINGAAYECPMQISVDDHMVTMIASDGNAFEPFVVDSFIIYPGERFDFVLYADKTATLRNYWLRARGMALCPKAHQTALLKYAGAPGVDPLEPTDIHSSHREGVLLNPWDTKGSDAQAEITRMRAEVPDGNDGVMTSLPDKKFYLGMDFYKVNNYKYNHPDYYPNSAVKKRQIMYSSQINRISSTLPASPPLTQYEDIPVSEYCNEQTVQQRCDQEWCHCIHKLDVALGDLVELVIVDEGADFVAAHPMHLHGFKFRTVAIDKLNVSTSVAEVKAMDERGEINRTISRAPLKDTVTPLDGGFTIIRFRADNPGIWLFHCHIVPHLDVGMALLLQVGNRSEFPKPPRNFPRCGSWQDNNTEDDGDGFDEDANQNKEDILVECSDSSTNAGSRLIAVHNIVKMFVVLMFVSKSVTVWCVY